MPKPENSLTTKMRSHLVFLYIDAANRKSLLRTTGGIVTGTVTI